MCNGNQSSVPPMPQEYYDILQKQQETMDSYLESVTSGTDLQKSLSGLYTSSEKDAFNPEVFEGIKDKINAYKSNPGGLEQFRDKEIPGWALDQLQMGGYDTRFAQKTDSSGKGQGSRIDPVSVFSRFVSSVESNPAEWAKYGAAKRVNEQAIDQGAVSSLRGRFNELQSKQYDIAKMELERYQKALEGKIPVSEGTRQAFEKKFQTLKEQAATSGGGIKGDTIDTAQGTDTASIASLEALKKEYDYYINQESHGDLSSMFGYRNTPTQESLAAGVSQGGAQGAMGAMGGFQSMLQPYQYQQGLQFQNNLANTQMQNQNQAGLMGLIGTGVGLALPGAMGAYRTGAQGLGQTPYTVNTQPYSLGYQTPTGYAPAAQSKLPWQQ